MAFAGMGVALSSLITPLVLITAGSVVLNAFTQRYDELGERLRSGHPGVTRQQLRQLRVSIVSVLTGLVGLALSVVALTLAVVLDSSALSYLAVSLVIVGALGVVLALANAAVALTRWFELASRLPTRGCHFRRVGGRSNNPPPAARAGFSAEPGLSLAVRPGLSNRPGISPGARSGASNSPLLWPGSPSKPLSPAGPPNTPALSLVAALSPSSWGRSGTSNRPLFMRRCRLRPI